MNRQRWTVLVGVGKTLQLILSAFGLFMLIVLYSPITDYLVRPLWVPAELKPAPAIVVLTAYVTGGGVMNESAMRRTHMAARLYRNGLAPLLIITGGNTQSQSTRQPADFMARFAEELGVPHSAILLEKASADTHESAVHVAALCRERGIQHVLLITDASHMRRAAGAFRAQHLQVSPAPADPGSLTWETPNVRLGKFWASLHEYAGLLYYWWKGWI